ncbi:hypothetical protein BpHYR1_054421 [Brachionus plicatilis]|uniref:Uncharacterized protein n=1 Tax=Brachionus plicatilis TaxID=10195 RepID=A0A3M7SE33_BRAPC|nr:hypothetical protein BpHYR1_054421 [Brachionus plicatilis]
MYLLNQYLKALNLDQLPFLVLKIRLIVKDELQVNGIVTNFIPPRMTNLLQQADVCWFASIKKQYHNDGTNADYIDELDEGDEIDGFDTDPNIVFELDPSDTSSQPAQIKYNYKYSKNRLIQADRSILIENRITESWFYYKFLIFL